MKTSMPSEVAQHATTICLIISSTSKTLPLSEVPLIRQHAEQSSSEGGNYKMDVPPQKASKNLSTRIKS